MSTFFQNTVVQHSNLCQPSRRLVAAAANALENCLSLFSSICNEIKLNDRDTILPWGWQEANSFLVFIFAPGHSGYYRVWRLVTCSCVSSFFQKRRPRRGRKDPPSPEKTSLINLSNLVKTLPWSVGRLLQERELLFVFKVLDCSSFKQTHLLYQLSSCY